MGKRSLDQRSLKGRTLERLKKPAVLKGKQFAQCRECTRAGAIRRESRRSPRNVLVGEYRTILRGEEIQVRREKRSDGLKTSLKDDDEILSLYATVALGPGKLGTLRLNDADKEEENNGVRSRQTKLSSTDEREQLRS